MMRRSNGFGSDSVSVDGAGRNLSCSSGVDGDDGGALETLIDFFLIFQFYALRGLVLIV